MGLRPLRIVVLGLSITSSWGNGHATTYRSLVRELASRGHELLFLERDAPWYRQSRDMARPPWCAVELYSSLDELRDCFAAEVRQADFVMVGSHVTEGAAAARWALSEAAGAVAFYDIDTPVTLARLGRGECEYLASGLIPSFDLYLSFTGGPTLERLEKVYGSPMARPLYCSVDTDLYRPAGTDKLWDIGYIGTYCADRQPALERLMLEPARRHKGRFIVVGALYPGQIEWPGNTQRVEHLPPSGHSAFYSSVSFAMNLTRADMVRAGYSPSVRLFEAAACAAPVITDMWPGLSEFFEPGSEILVSGSAEQTIGYLRDMPEAERLAIGLKARARVLARHTAAHRVDDLEGYMAEALERRSCAR